MKKRPPIDDQQVENYAKLGADDEDIATLVGVSVALLNRRYRRSIARARAERRTLIRKIIWAAVIEGNPTLLTWLGKVELGWIERKSQAGDYDARSPQKRFDFEAFAAEFARLHEVTAPAADSHDPANACVDPAETDGSG